ncbi:SDR family oxidoreductase [Sulfitobacter pontiacus]|jgi:nucleoside-diphosphate-sugar epimerase|uniref:SDR family oxidoreductase n=1 Tax=Sulfitobacter pontiacus TaxID=60137 RepID=UPI000C681B4F|nr:SDR family oxidoreductase [Sulfitobacter pontiacus]MAX77745.1 NAD(P)-dependent oxidoreductase [Roseobacter sp.]UWR19318.1 SDR family oxidoreductase [Sulfitobacter pontiacus]BDY14524.1 NAD(P)-dependent oxidoreductase [Sulfitobacter pontiacus]HCT31856.1 NAD(P)-dependent oxidoreductase [Sulfitobacter sp.]
MEKTLLSIGHGFSARALAARLVPQGWRIVGTTRSPDKADAIADTGVEPVVWPGADLGALIAQFPNVLVSAGPDSAGDPVLNAVEDAVTRAAPDLRWVGYLSTTGVYGDHDGDWVDEDTPLTPSTKRGRARVTAEARWQAIPDLPLHIFRLAGIYGPGRGPFAKVRAGTARRIIKQGQVFSRIHVEDIAQALELSLQRPDPGAVYNLCDDDPAPPQDVIAHAAELLGLPVPPAIPFDQADMTPMARSFYAESKKVRNDRIKQALGWAPQFPTYRAGLAALLAQDS